jgi:hypothetical protein
MVTNPTRDPSFNVLSLSLPSPKAPPEYPDLYGKRREMAKIQMLEREISFLEVCNCNSFSSLTCFLFSLSQYNQNVSNFHNGRRRRRRRNFI